MDGVDQLICCSVEGEVRGYKPMPPHLLNLTTDRNVNQEAVREMAQRKQVGGDEDFNNLKPFLQSTNSNKNLQTELDNLVEASKPSVERKFDQFGSQSTGIPVIL